MELLLGTLAALAPLHVRAAVYYVRHAGDDAKDGHSPATAWQHVERLGGTLHAGDVAYVGPGEYREEITMRFAGSQEAPITLVADTSGQHTGDPPGPVILVGSDPVDEARFQPGTAPGTFSATFPDWDPTGVVELDGPQRRYLRVITTAEYLTEHVPALEVVARRRSSFFWDGTTRTLTLHTSDDRPPTAHEIEIVRRGNGVIARALPWIAVIGFTVRHVQDAGVNFFEGAHDGAAIGVTVWGSRQGVRVFGSAGVLVSASTLFRNENSGVYFAAGSTAGKAIGNTLYENLKGLRWSSSSSFGLATDNTAFDNDERGISVEDADDLVLRGNRLVGNGVSQLLVMKSRLSSDANCFQSTAPGQLVADFRPWEPQGTHATLAAYRAAGGQERQSREGDCGALPARVDVQRLSHPAPAPSG